MAKSLIDARAIRDASVEDADAIARVEVLTWGVSYGEMLPPQFATRSLERARARWVRMLGLERSAQARTTLVGVEGDSVVAFACGGVARGPSRMARLDMLYVLPEHQGSGMGHALLRGFASRVSEAGVTALWVEVLAKNASARRFYRRAGAIELQRTWEIFGTKPVVVVSYGWSLPDGLARIG